MSYNFAVLNRNYALINAHADVDSVGIGVKLHVYSFTFQMHPHFEKKPQTSIHKFCQ